VAAHHDPPVAAHHDPPVAAHHDPLSKLQVESCHETRHVINSDSNTSSHNDVSVFLIPSTGVCKRKERNNRYLVEIRDSIRIWIEMSCQWFRIYDASLIRRKDNAMAGVCDQHNSSLAASEAAEKQKNVSQFVDVMFSAKTHFKQKQVLFNNLIETNRPRSGALQPGIKTHVVASCVCSLRCVLMMGGWELVHFRNFDMFIYLF